MRTEPEAFAPGSVAVAVSGGVDSLYALVSLRRRGLAAFALHGRFLPSQGKPDPVPLLEQQCAKLGLPLYVADLTQEFAEAVIHPFAASYASAQTPNPCVWCNARIKFGLLLDFALAHGATSIATGHYARLDPHPVYGFGLRRGRDSGKDQSYFLAGVPKERLGRACFPLAEKRKADLAVELASLGFEVPLPSESQEICFIPQDAYRPFLQSLSVPLSGPGPILLADGRQVGTHEGLWRYTQGQRRGLGISWHEPLYVVDKDTDRNALIVGGAGELHVAGCLAESPNILVPMDVWPSTVFAQVRYRQKAVPARVRYQEGRMEVYFNEPQSPAAPGQLLVVYDPQGLVLAGATISMNMRSESA